MPREKDKSRSRGRHRSNKADSGRLSSPTRSRQRRSRSVDHGSRAPFEDLASVGRAASASSAGRRHRMRSGKHSSKSRSRSSRSRSIGSSKDGTDEDELARIAQMFALDEFEKAYKAERQKIEQSGGGEGKRRRKRHEETNDDNNHTASTRDMTEAERAAQKKLLSPAGVQILDDLLEHILMMRSGRWDNVQLVSAPDFGEVVRVDDQGVLLIAPTRTHIHVPDNPTEPKLLVLNHLFETLQYNFVVEFDRSNQFLIMINEDNGERLDLRYAHVVPTPLFLRSERATRGVVKGLPGEIIVKSPSSSSTTDAAAADANDDEQRPGIAPKREAKKRRDMSRVQWRLSRNINVEFISTQIHPDPVPDY